MKMEVKTQKKFEPITVELVFETEEDVTEFFSAYDRKYNDRLSFDKIDNLSTYQHPFNKFQKLVKFA